MTEANAEVRSLWSRVVLIGSVVAAVLPLVGALGTRFGVWNFGPGLLILVVGLLLAVIGTIAGIVGLILAIRRGRNADRTPLLLGSAIAAIVVVFLGMQFLAGRGVPPIHDITTDVDDPPEFDVVVEMRGEVEGVNPLTYDASKIAPLQKAAYPNVVPLEVAAPPATVFDAAVDVLVAHGLVVVNSDRSALRIEAVATSFWFGFKDDLVVRIRPSASGGSHVDARSVSRVGVGDVGVNAARIERFLDGLRAKTG